MFVCVFRLIGSTSSMQLCRSFTHLSHASTSAIGLVLLDQLLRVLAGVGGRIQLLVAQLQRRRRLLVRNAAGRQNRGHRFGERTGRTRRRQLGRAELRAGIGGHLVDAYGDCG